VLFYSDLVIRWGSVAVVVAVGLVGCSGASTGAPRTSTVTVTPTASATPSPSVSPSPALPAAAQQPTRAGAQAFARYFFAVYNYAFWTADPAPLKAISDKDCVFCASSIDAVRAIQQEQDVAQGGRIEVLVAVAAPGDPQERLLVNMSLYQESGRTLSRQGQVVDTTPERRNGRVDLVVRWVGERWILVEGDIKRDGEQ
jgi:hypothetical protein